jgi:hypothetical protein
LPLPTKSPATGRTLSLGNFQVMKREDRSEAFSEIILKHEIERSWKPSVFRAWLVILPAAVLFVILL